MRKFIFLFALLIAMGSGLDVKAQGFFKKIFKKKEKTESVSALTLEEQRLVQEIQWNESLYIHAKESQLCEEEDAIVSIPQPYQRINLNEGEQCDLSYELSSGVTIDPVYLTNKEYYQLWDTRSINIYDVPVKNFKDTVQLHLHDGSAFEGWSYPLDNEMHVTSKYGFRRWRFHHGVDLRLSIGDTIRSVFDGVVRIAKYNRRGYGYYVVVRHDNGLETLYGHMKKYIVQPGMKVKAGEPIGLGGNTGRSTGPHLHFEVRYEGNGFNPDELFHFEEKPEMLASEFSLTPEHYTLLIESSKSVYHRIRSGDSLWKISRRYGTSINKICRLNGISRRTTLRVGRKIRVR